MSTINKTSALSQFASALAALNVSTAETETLVLYLKTAINAGASASAIITELTDRIEAVGSSAEIKELVLLIVATSLITEDRVLTVPDLSTLTGMTNAIEGTVFFVESKGFPYIRKSNGDWVVIDPSLQKPATPNAYAWGYNAFGQLGDETTADKSSPVATVGGISDWTHLDASLNNSVALRANGTAWAWGSNGGGQLGDGTTTNRSSPVSVIGGITNWTQISPGAAHTLALRTDGTAWSWGLNSSGQLGDGTTVSKLSPISVVGGFVNWIQVSAGGRHSLALRSDGTAWGWGNNLFGRLGDNSTTNRTSPVSVVGGIVNWIQLSAGGGVNTLAGFQHGHSVGLRADGTAWAWGNNASGQLGDATTTGKSSPVAVVGGIVDWAQVSAGERHNLAIRANGTAWAWGYNGFGQLGDGTITSKTSPISVVGGFTDWIQVSAPFAYRSAGLRADGTAWSWGYNANGELGDGTTTSKRSPVSVVGGFTDWVQISSGDKTTVGLRGS